MQKIGIMVFLVSLAANTVAAVKPEVVVNEYINAWNAHDKQKIASFYAQDVTWYDLASDKSITGKEHVAPKITSYFMAYVKDMYWYKSGDVYVSGDTVIYEWTYGGTFNGAWGDQKIVNKDFSLKGLSTSTINSNGKIISQKDYYDMDSFKRVLGVIK